MPNTRHASRALISGARTAGLGSLSLLIVSGKAPQKTLLLVDGSSYLYRAFHALPELKSPRGEMIELTKGEFSLLAAFLSAPQRILAREQLLDLSRLHNAEVYDRSIDVQILRLRRKIEEDPSHPRFIVTERGVGYVFSSAVETVR